MWCMQHMIHVPCGLSTIGLCANGFISPDLFTTCRCVHEFLCLCTVWLTYHVVQSEFKSQKKLCLSRRWGGSRPEHQGSSFWPWDVCGNNPRPWTWALRKKIHKMGSAASLGRVETWCRDLRWDCHRHPPPLPRHLGLHCHHGQDDGLLLYPSDKKKTVAAVDEEGQADPKPRSTPAGQNRCCLLSLTARASSTRTSVPGAPQSMWPTSSRTWASSWNVCRRRGLSWLSRSGCPLSAPLLPSSRTNSLPTVVLTR